MDKIINIWLHPKRTASEIRRLKAELEVSETDNDSLRGKLDELQIENARLAGRAEVSETGQKQFMDEMIRQRAEFEAREAELRSKLDEATAGQAQLEEIESFVDRMIETKNEYKKRLRSLKRELSDAKLQIARLQGSPREIPEITGFETGYDDSRRETGSQLFQTGSVTPSDCHDEASDWLEPLPQK